MTLYRKYRPQTFTQLTGQEPIRTTLQNEIATGAIAHAYLFTGPRGVGKTTTARLFAKAVNCEKGHQGDACLRCASCLAIQGGTALDLIEIDAASHTQVDHVRDTILPTARTAPASARYKVFIIDEVHMLSAAAFNALLKMLEEPPAHVIFILATTEIHRVPETIISRCQRFDFKRINHADLVERLRWIGKQEKVSVDDEVLRAIAESADGSLRDAEVTLGQLMALGEKRITRAIASVVLPLSDWASYRALLGHLAGGKTAEAILAMHKLQDDGADIVRFTEGFLRFFRQALLLKVAPKAGPSLGSLDDPKRAKELHALLETISLSILLLWVDLFLETFERMKRSALPMLPLEIAIIRATLAEGAAPAPAKPEETGATDPLPVQTSSPPKPSPAGGGTAAVNAVRDEHAEAGWRQIMQAMKKKNHGLSVLLNLAVPAALQENVMTLELPYAFHIERLKEARYMKVLEETAAEVLGRPLRFVYAIGASRPPMAREPKKAPQAAPAGQNLWESVVKAFGTDIAES